MHEFLLARKHLLLHAGFTKYELREATNEVKKIQKIVNFQKNTILFPIYDAGFAIRSVAKSNGKYIVSSPNKKEKNIQLTGNITS